MLKKLYEKSRVWSAVLWIVIYVMVMGNLQANFGTGSLYTMIGLLVIAGALIGYIRKNGQGEYYGLKTPAEGRRYLYFIPLALIASVNLWCGIRLHYDPAHQLIALLAMAVSGFVEEVIFRGLLFRGIAEKNLREAVIISSVTFGMGHIVNLLTGAPLLETVLQILYAIAIGFAFVMVFLKSGSIVPCVLCHSFINMTAELAGEGNTVLMYVQVVFLIVVSAGYAVYLRKLKN